MKIANFKLIAPSLLTLLLAISDFASAAPNPRIADGKAPSSAATANEEEMKKYTTFHNEVMPLILEQSKVKEFIEKEDVSFYLLTWLREEELQEAKAQEELLKHLRWRSDEKIDEIDKESFKEIKKDLPAFFDTVGKKGQPVLEIWFSSWKLKEYFDANKHHDMLRYIYYLLEMNNRRIYEDQIKSHGKENKEGEDSLGALMILDLKNIMTDWNDCEDCTDLLQAMFALIQENYPRSYQTIYIVNAPLSFQITLDFFTANFTKSLKESIKTFGEDKEEWSGALSEKIDKAQRSERFNGEKDRGEEFKEGPTTESWKFEMTSEKPKKSEEGAKTAEKPDKKKDKEDKKDKDDKKDKKEKENSGMFKKFVGMMG